MTPPIAPSLGRPILSAVDAKELWRSHFGDRPVPAGTPRETRTVDEEGGR